MKKHSLTGRTIRITVTSSVLFAFVALFIGLSIYGSGILKEYISRSFTIAEHAHYAVRNVADAPDLTRQVMEIYHSLTPEQQEADNYADYFAGIDTAPDTGSEYDVLFHMLQGYTVDVDDVYLGMYDPDANRLIYVLDSDRNEETRMATGAYDVVSEEECR